MKKTKHKIYANVFLFGHFIQMPGQWLLFMGLRAEAGRTVWVYFVPLSAVRLFLQQAQTIFVITILKLHYPLRKKTCKFLWHFLHSKTKYRPKRRDLFNTLPSVYRFYWRQKQHKYLPAKLLYSYYGETDCLICDSCGIF